jgi:hypothetical protein
MDLDSLKYFKIGVRPKIDYYYVTKDKQHGENIVIKSMDGILYGFVRREKKESDKISLFPSDDG